MLNLGSKFTIFDKFQRKVQISSTRNLLRRKVATYFFDPRDAAAAVNSWSTRGWILKTQCVESLRQIWMQNDDPWPNVGTRTAEGNAQTNKATVVYRQSDGYELNRTAKRPCCSSVHFVRSVRPLWVGVGHTDFIRPRWSFSAKNCSRSLEACASQRTEVCAQ